MPVYEFRGPVSATIRTAARSGWGLKSAVVLGAALAVASGGLAVPHWHVPWAWLAVAGTFAGCAAVAYGGLVFSRWESRREMTRMRAERPERMRWPVRGPAEGETMRP